MGTTQRAQRPTNTNQGIHTAPAVVHAGNGFGAVRCRGQVGERVTAHRDLELVRCYLFYKMFTSHSQRARHDPPISIWGVSLGKYVSLKSLNQETKSYYVLTSIYNTVL